MVRFRPTSFGRRLALLAAILFAALTFVASGPHQHLLRQAAAAATAGVSHASAADGHAAYHAAAARTDATCPLCDWLATPSQPSIVVTAPIVRVAVAVEKPRSCFAEPRCSLPLPLLGLRAPPASAA